MPVKGPKAWVLRLMQKGIACIISTDKTLNYVLESPVQLMKDRRCLFGLSHYLAQNAVRKTIAYLEMIAGNIKLGVKVYSMCSAMPLEKCVSPLWNSNWLPSINVIIERKPLLLFLWDELFSSMLWQACNGNSVRCNCNQRVLPIWTGIKLDWVEFTITTWMQKFKALFNSSDQSFPLVDILKGWIWEVGWHSSYLVQETWQNIVDIWEKWLGQIQKTPMSFITWFFLVK